MQIAKFYGHSDDNIVVEDIKGADEFSCYSSNLHRATFDLGGKMRIHALYDGCWSFSVAKVAEEVELPLWPVVIKQSDDCPYSVQLTVAVPDDVKVKRIEG